MPKARTPIPPEISSEVMFRHLLRCCICHRERTLQIHHIDEDPTNHGLDNLAVLCLEHHELTQIRGGFGKKLKAVDIIRHKDDWLKRVVVIRDRADQLISLAMAGGNAINDVSFTEEAVSSTRAPSDETIIGFLHALPHLRRAAHIAGKPRWDSGTGSEMVQGCYDAIAILEGAWLKLAELYPPNHFSDRPAHHFFSDFLAARFAWHRQIYEPRGPSSGGTIINEIVSGNVLDDAENLIAETVEGMYVGLYLNDFDLSAWQMAWKSADSISTTFASKATACFATLKGIVTWPLHALNSYKRAASATPPRSSHGRPERI